MPQRLTDMDITRVSAVDKGANGRAFAIFKRAESGAEEAQMPDPETSPVGQASALRKIADWLVAKAATFGSIIAGRELSEAVDDSYDTLWTALWSAMYATDANGQDLPMVDKQALVAQSLDEFKAYLLSAMQTGVGKRARPTDIELAKRRVDALVRTAGATADPERVERLTKAAEAFVSVLATDTEIDAGADAQEVDMTGEELTAAVAKAMEPLTDRIEAIEKRLPEPAAVEGAAESGDELTLEGVAKAVLEIRETVDGIAKARGERTSADGQEAGGSPVKKSRWAGVF